MFVLIFASLGLVWFYGFFVDDSWLVLLA